MLQLTGYSRLKLASGIITILLSFTSIAQVKITETVFDADTSGIIITQSSDFLFVGEEVEITVRGCSGNMRLLEASVNGRRFKADEEDKVLVTIPSGPIGRHTVPVEAVCMDTDGNRVVKRSKVVYHVRKARAVQTKESFRIVVSQNLSSLLQLEDIEVTINVCGDLSRVKSITANRYILKHENGIAKIKYPAGSLGVHELPVETIVVDVDGNWHIQQDTLVYEVVQSFAMIAPDRLNLLYIGIDNPVTVLTSTGEHGTGVHVSGGGASIMKVRPHSYLLRVKSVSDSCVLTVTVKNNPVMSSIFRTRHLPVPVAKVGRHSSGSKISQKELSSLPGITAVLEDFTFDIKYKTLAYSIHTYTTEGSNKTFVSAQSAFPSEAKTHLSQLPSGSLVVITDILVEEPGGRKVPLPAIVFNVN